MTVMVAVGVRITVGIAVTVLASDRSGCLGEFPLGVIVSVTVNVKCCVTWEVKSVNNKPTNMIRNMLKGPTRTTAATDARKRYINMSTLCLSLIILLNLGRHERASYRLRGPRRVIKCQGYCGRRLLRGLPECTLNHFLALVGCRR
jgi:hypothetical protein